MMKQQFETDDSSYWIGSFSSGIARISAKGLFGIIDVTGKIICPLKYDYMDEFSGATTIAGLNGKYVVVSNSGKELTLKKYDMIWPFAEGIAIAELNNKWGYISSNGQELVPIRYEYATSFSNGFASLKLDGKWMLVDNRGKRRCAPRYDTIGKIDQGRIIVRSGADWATIDSNGNEIILNRSYEKIAMYTDGRLRVKQSGKWGIAAYNGDELVPCSYDDIQPYIRGYEKVGLEVNLAYCPDDPILLRGYVPSQKTMIWGIIDSAGKQIVPFKYSHIGKMTASGLAAVSMPWECASITHAVLGKYSCYMDKSGREVFPDQFSYATIFADGRALVGLNGKCGWIDTAGNEVTPFIYDYIQAVSPSVWFVVNDKHWKFVDSALQSITTSSYDQILPLRYSVADTTPVKYLKTRKGQYWGIADVTGHDVIVPRYAEIEVYSDNLFRIKDSTGYQLITTEGKILTKHTYSSIGFPASLRTIHHYRPMYPQNPEVKISRHPNGILSVRDGNLEGCIDLCGNEIIPCSFTSIEQFDKGLALVERDEKFGFMNLTGVTTVPCVYDFAESFKDNLALVKRDGKYGFIDRTGKVIIPLIYEQAYAFEGGVAGVVLNGDYFTIDKGGNRIYK